MKGKVIKEHVIGGAFCGELTEENPYGYKISFLAGSEWDVSLDEMKGVKCVNDLTFVRIPVELATDIFGPWINEINKFPRGKK